MKTILEIPSIVGVFKCVVLETENSQDFEAFLDLWKSYNEQDRGLGYRQYEVKEKKIPALRNKFQEYVWFGLYRNNDIVGHASLKFLANPDDDYDEDDVTIAWPQIGTEKTTIEFTNGNIFDKKDRGHGYANLLYKARMKHAQSLGYKFVQVYADNYSSAKAAYNNGFRKIPSRFDDPNADPIEQSTYMYLIKDLSN